MPEYIYTITVEVEAKDEAAAFRQIKPALQACDEVDTDKICQHDGGKLYTPTDYETWETT